tara:strand:- start:2138 stop:2833 length:696 start_codon:yes stop_codon:yes gene_type:complete
MDDKCFMRGARAEGVLLYKDKPITGISRVYLLEDGCFNGTIFEKQLADQLSTGYIKQLREAEISKNKQILTEIMNNSGMIYSLIDQGDNRPLKVYVDKNKYNCKNLGGKRESIDRTGNAAFFREVYEETGYCLKQALLNGSVEDCINGKYVITLNTQSYDELVQSYSRKYNSHDTEIQTLLLGKDIIAGTTSQNIKTGCKNYLDKNEYKLYKKKYLKYKKKYLDLKRAYVR